jgi:predicted phosphate transport protein (TIGR00153 family)
MRLFKKRRSIFLKLLIDQAKRTQEGIEYLKNYMSTEDSNIAKDIDNKEKEGDEVRRILIDEINRTFSTPFDREDIFALSRAIDDILDYANTAVDEMNILNIKTNPHLIKMSDILEKSARNLYQAIKMLPSHPRVSTNHVIKVKEFENRLEGSYRKALSELFSTPDDLEGIITILKTRELYRHLSNAGDRCDEAADIIGDLLVKNY